VYIAIMTVVFFRWAREAEEAEEAESAGVA
jgi:hypothetical protein